MQNEINLFSFRIMLKFILIVDKSGNSFRTSLSKSFLKKKYQKLYGKWFIHNIIFEKSLGFSYFEL